MIWSHTFPGAGAASPGTIAVGPDGDLWLAGTFIPPLSIGDSTLSGDGGAHVFVARLDASANPRWAAPVGCAGYVGIALDADGNALVATPCGLFKLDPKGRQLWQEGVLPTVDHDGWMKLHAAAPDGAGGILLMGRLDGTIQAGTSMLRGSTSTFLARFDGNGAPRWAVNVGPGADMDPVQMASDGAGNVVIGTHSTTGQYIRLAKVDPSGAVHGRGIVRAVSDYVQFGAIAMNRRGDVVLSGGGRIVLSDGNPVGADRKPWIVRLASSGDDFWPQPAPVGLLANDAAGDVLFTSGSSVGKLDSSGAAIWSYAPAITGGANLGAMTVTPAGRLVIAGTFSGSYDFGGGPVESGAGGALFVAGLAP